jgi:hypothetical protein
VATGPCVSLTVSAPTCRLASEAGHLARATVLSRTRAHGPVLTGLLARLMPDAAAPDPHARRLLRPADATAPAWTQCGPLRPGLRDTVRLGRERLRCYAHVAGRRTPPPGV